MILLGKVQNAGGKKYIMVLEGWIHRGSREAGAGSIGAGALSATQCTGGSRLRREN